MSLSRRRQNAIFLKRVTKEIAAEFEAMSYARLADPNEPLLYAREVEGIRITWSVDVINKRPNGDILVALEFRSDMKTFPFGEPAYSFWKQAR